MSGVIPSLLRKLAYAHRAFAPCVVVESSISVMNRCFRKSTYSSEMFPTLASSFSF